MRRLPAPSALLVLPLLVVLASCGDGSLADRPGAAEESVQSLALDATDEGQPEVVLVFPGPDQELVGQGVVTDRGDGPVLCLGFIEESAPPGCAGVPLVGWDPTAATVAPYWETVGDGGWGEFAVTGTYDGTALTITQDPTTLALHDAAPQRVLPVDPSTLPPNGLSEDEALDVADTVSAALPQPSDVSVQSRRVVVEVPYDDMTLQTVLDREHGDDVVLVRSLLAPVEPVLE